jgi:hypothetical protein
MTPTSKLCGTPEASVVVATVSPLGATVTARPFEVCFTDEPVWNIAGWPFAKVDFLTDEPTVTFAALAAADADGDALDEDEDDELGVELPLEPHAAAVVIPAPITSAASDRRRSCRRGPAMAARPDPVAWNDKGFSPSWVVSTGSMKADHRAETR